MNSIKSFIVLMTVLLAFNSCSEEKLEPINKDDGIPEKVSSVEVKNLSGKVQISYAVPKDIDLLYVEAECEMADGKIVNTKSSYYNKFVEIDGFGAAKEYQVKLYSVSRGLKRSEPVVVKVNPLEPPITAIFNSLNVVEDFGGLTIGFKNEEKAEISLLVDVKNPKGEWSTAETFYTSQEAGKLSVRGLEAKLQSFRIYINDRWGNKTQVLDTELTPLYEVELDKKLFTQKKMPNDPASFGANHVHFMWNNNLSGTASGSGGWYRTQNGSGIPAQFVVNLGVKAKLSRFSLWQRGSVAEQNLLYTAGSPRIFEIWGSNDPDLTGGDLGWVKLGEYELIKPSGQPIPTNSPEDLEQAAKGHEFSIPLEAPSVQYVRVRVIRTFGITNYYWLSELSFFGQPTN